MDTAKSPVAADLPMESSFVPDITPDSNGGEDVEPVVKEEEVVKKTTTELTTTKQIETRVKRQLMLEDGKVVQDTGPMVETNTTEDTDRQRRQTVERRKLGDAVQAPDAITTGDSPANPHHSHLRAGNNGNGDGDDREETGSSNMAPREDGLVRATHTSVLLSREENNERLETEDVQHLGDFSDETYLNAVRAGHPNLGDELREAEFELRTTRQQALVAEPRIVAHTHRSKKTVDTEDTDTKYLVQPDGTLVTESKRTTGHEEVRDDDVSEGGADDVLTDGPCVVHEKQSSQNCTKQRDEQTVEIVADGQIIGTETRYAAETTNMEGDPHDKPGGECWDSLSDRMRKARRHQRAVLHKQQQLLQKGVTAPGASNNVADRKDALTERPLDFDREEQTRKGETMKWLENHFGSELSASTTSSSSLSAVAEPTQESRAAATKKTFFNVTFKSNSTVPDAAMAATQSDQFNKPAAAVGTPLARSTVLLSPSKVIIPERDTTATPPAVHHHHQTATLERFRQHNKQVHQRHFAGSREDLLAISHKNELNRIGLHELQEGQQPLQHPQRTHPVSGHYGSVQNLRESRARSNEPSFIDRNGYDERKMPIPVPVPVKEDLGYLSGSRNDVRTIHETSDIFAGRHNVKTSTPIATVPHLHRKDSGYVRGSRDDIRAVSSSMMHLDYAGSADERSLGRGPKHQPGNITQRPAVPQRRNKPAPIPVKTQSVIELAPQPQHHQHPEPRPDYPRSRSLTPPPLSNPHNPQLMQSTQTLHHQQRPRPNHKKAASAPPPPILVKKPESSIRLADATTTTTPERRKPSVTAAIGNSIRKFVDRLRSVSTDRRQRNKAAKLVKLQRSQSQDAPFKKGAKSSVAHSSDSSSMNINNYQAGGGNGGGSTYQQYNVIDGHIAAESGSTTMPRTGRNFRSASQDVDSRHKQSYYMGEDPYGDTIHGQPPPRPLAQQKKVGSSLLFNGSSPHLSSPQLQPQQQPHQQHGQHTLGRYSKSTNRLAPQQQHQYAPAAPGSSARHHQAQPSQYHHQRHYQDYRSTQTLPRKLSTADHPKHSSPMMPQQPAAVQTPLQNTGPAKPARTYNTNANSRIVNRSKSFNVHGVNGGTAHHQNAVPIFIEKKQPPAVQRKANSALMYRSTPHLLHDETQPHRGGGGGGSLLSGQLKSPSIVNLVSRSQRDLSRIAENKPLADSEEYAYHRNLAIHSAASRMSPAPVVNRDTASIVRGGSSSDDYSGESSLGQRMQRNRRAVSAAPLNAKPLTRKTLSTRY